MAHIVLHEDKSGQLIDLTYYCSDTCAKSNSDYAGWYGCVEVPSEAQPMLCASCNVTL
jgi:hypothetical protein